MWRNSILIGGVQIFHNKSAIHEVMGCIGFVAVELVELTDLVVWVQMALAHPCMSLYVYTYMCIYLYQDICKDSGVAAEQAELV